MGLNPTKTAARRRCPETRRTRQADPLAAVGKGERDLDEWYESSSPARPRTIVFSRGFFPDLKARRGHPWSHFRTYAVGFGQAGGRRSSRCPLGDRYRGAQGHADHHVLLWVRQRPVLRRPAGHSTIGGRGANPARGPAAAAGRRGGRECERLGAAVHGGGSRTARADGGCRDRRAIGLLLGTGMMT